MSGFHPKKTPEGEQPDAIDAKKQAPPTHLLSREEIQKEYGLSRRWLELAALKGNGPSVFAARAVSPASRFFPASMKSLDHL